MSLTVSLALKNRAQFHYITTVEFIDCLKTSLPNAWRIVEDLAERKHAGQQGLVSYAPSDMADRVRGELLRMMASDAIRDAIEEHFGMRFAFQNCHATAAFLPEEEAERREFTSIRAQILAQSPDLVDC